MSSSSKSRFLNLPTEVRVRIYWWYIAKCRVYLEGNNDYTVGNNEPLANLRVGEKTDQEGDSVGLARLDLCFVCRQISAEFIPFFAANTKLYLDVRHSVGSAHMSVIPHWYAAAVQEVVFTTNEIDRPCLALFPNLKRAKLHTPEYRHLPLPRGTRRWTKADVEKENVIRKISSRAIKRFTAGRSATDKAVAGREFSLMVVIEFGDFIARFPGRDPKLVGTLKVKVTESIVHGRPRVDSTFKKEFLKALSLRPAKQQWVSEDD